MKRLRRRTVTEADLASAAAQVREHRAAGDELDLAVVLVRQARLLLDADRATDALAVLAEAELVCLAGAEQRPDEFADELTEVRERQANCQYQLLQAGDELTAARAVAQVYQRLAAEDPRHRQPCAGVLTRLAGLLMGAQAYQEALPVVREAVALARDLPELETFLVSNLIMLAGLEREVGDDANAVRAGEEAAARCRALPEGGVREPLLADALHNLGVALLDQDRHQDALTVIEEGIALRRTLADADPGPHEPNLAIALANAAACHAALGNPDAAERTATEAATLRQGLAL